MVRNSTTEEVVAEEIKNVFRHPTDKGNKQCPQRSHVGTLSIDDLSLFGFHGFSRIEAVFNFYVITWLIHTNEAQQKDDAVLLKRRLTIGRL